MEREYGLGRMRVDLLILWPLNPAVEGRPDWIRWNGPIQKAVVECKVRHKGLERTIGHGLEQTAAYMKRSGAGDRHLVIFNREKGGGLG